MLPVRTGVCATIACPGVLAFLAWLDLAPARIAPAVDPEDTSSSAPGADACGGQVKLPAQGDDCPAVEVMDTQIHV